MSFRHAMQEQEQLQQYYAHKRTKKDTKTKESAITKPTTVINGEKHNIS